LPDHAATYLTAHAKPALLSPPLPPASSTLLPYTTLFRSGLRRGVRRHLPSSGHRQPDHGRVRQLPHRAGARHGAERLLHLHGGRSEEHTSELQSREKLVCRLLLEKKNSTINGPNNPKIRR